MQQCALVSGQTRLRLRLSAQLSTVAVNLRAFWQEGCQKKRCVSQKPGKTSRAYGNHRGDIPISELNPVNFQTGSKRSLWLPMPIVSSAIPPLRGVAP
jgi:hypothetical protein